MSSIIPETPGSFKGDLTISASPGRITEPYEPPPPVCLVPSSTGDASAITPPSPSNGELREGAQDNGEGNQDQRTPEERSPLPVTEPKLGSPSPGVFGSITLGVLSGDNKQDEREQKDEKTSGSDHSVFTFLPIFEKSFWKCVPGFILRIEPYLILIFTAILVALACLQRRLNKKFFLIANRPKLRLRSLECEQFEGSPKSSIQGLGERFCPEFRALFGIVNVGGTKAIPLHGYLHVRRSRHLSSDWRPAWKSLQCENIEAGKEVVVTLHKPKWSLQERDKDIGPGYHFFLIGGIRYKDSLDREYVTNFCRDHRIGSGYRLMDNSDYEYED